MHSRSGSKKLNERDQEVHKRCVVLIFEHNYGGRDHFLVKNVYVVWIRMFDCNSKFEIIQRSGRAMAYDVHLK